MSDSSQAGGSIAMHEFQRTFHLPSGLTEHSLVEVEIGIDEPWEHLVSIACSVNRNLLNLSNPQPGLFRGPVGLENLLPVNEIELQLAWREARAPAWLPAVCLVLS